MAPTVSEIRLQNAEYELAKDQLKLVRLQIQLMVAVLEGRLCIAGQSVYVTPSHPA